MEGCETHADNFGGTVLLTRKPGYYRRDGTPPAISVTASLGKGPAGCAAPPLKRYRLGFAFDRGDYQLLSTRSVE